MTAGSVLAVSAVVGIAVAPSLPVFFAGWALAGVAMAGTLYPPAFAALTRWWGPQRVRALTALTLLAGLASTIFAPSAAALLGALGWRPTYLVLAAVLAVVTIPAHLIGLRGRWPDPEPAPAPDTIEAGPDGPADVPRAVARSRPFVLLAAALGLGAFTAFAVVVNQVSLLIERGLSTSAAAWALGLGGLGQVLGRLGYSRLAEATGPRARAVLILALSAAATGVYAVVPGPAALLIAVAMLAGAARGVVTLLQATAITDRWGAAHYGRLNGILTAPTLVATAVAPWAGAALAGALGGFPPMFAVLAALSGVAAAFAWGTTPAPPREARYGRSAPT
jgi:MFS family permease